MPLEGVCRKRYISVFTLVLCKCLLCSYIIFKLKQVNDREMQTQCFYEQRTASGANMLNSLSCHQGNWHLLWKRTMCTHGFLAKQEFSAVSTQISSKRKESTSHWGEQRRNRSKQHQNWTLRCFAGAVQGLEE